MGSPIDIEQKVCESTLWTFDITNTSLISPMTLSLDFQGQILKKL